MRLWALEKATIVAELAKLDPADDPEIDRTAIACQTLVNGSHWIEYMSRSENRHDRLYNRAMFSFHKQRAWRREEIKKAGTNLTID